MPFIVKSRAGEIFCHPSQDTSNRFPKDQMLRANGFQIYSRKGDKEPVWERDGRRCPESIAVALVSGCQLD